MYIRSLDLSKIRESFFLWGPRQTGKSSLLRSTFPNAVFINLLESDQFMKYSTEPFRLREEVEGSHLSKPIIIIDEVQKVPLLLDEVHNLIEKHKIQFGLCGSSARKVKRGHANLLGGRALRFELHGLTKNELGDDFNLEKIVNHGYLPRHYLAEDPRSLLRSYVADYLKEEIAAEALVRNLPSFSRFLETASLSDTEQVNYSTMGRDVGVSPPTIASYFEILCDTLIGSFLAPFALRPKRRTSLAPKFYFFDVGVVNHLAQRGGIKKKSELFGKALENYIYHELRAAKSYLESDKNLSFWRLGSGIEVDFVIGRADVAIEVKGTDRIHSDHLKGLRAFKEEYPKVKRRILVCLEKTNRKTDDEIEILSVEAFTDTLQEILAI